MSARRPASGARALCSPQRFRQPQAGGIDVCLHGRSRRAWPLLADHVEDLGVLGDDPAVARWGLEMHEMTQEGALIVGRIFQRPNGFDEATISATLTRAT
jgi:hypothetical protein